MPQHSAALSESPSVNCSGTAHRHSSQASRSLSKYESTRTGAESSNMSMRWLLEDLAPQANLCRYAPCVYPGTSETWVPSTLHLNMCAWRTR